jgi:pimeloyl-ACP methyl ester carboxylesterase
MTPAYFTAPDGVSLAYYELGEGRPLLLIHGYISDAHTNWMKFVPTAQRLAEAGFRVIMPDLRAHGASDKPHDPAAYPKDILTDDMFALITHLGLTDLDAAGYSLGARTLSRMMARGFRPARAILAGMGLEGLTQADRRAGHFRAILTNLGRHAKGSPEWFVEAFLKTSGGDAVALNLLIDAFEGIEEAVLRGWNFPIGVVCGVDDFDNGNAQALAEALPQGHYYPIPGNHMSAVTKPELGAAMVDFLTR